MMYMMIYITDMPYIAGQYTFLFVKKIEGPTLYKLNNLDLSIGVCCFPTTPDERTLVNNIHQTSTKEVAIIMEFHCIIKFGKLLKFNRNCHKT